MVQSVPNVVRLTTALLTIVALSACGSLPFQTRGTDEAGVSDANTCPSLRRASAWINAMPTIGERPKRPLIVAVEVQGGGQWQLDLADTDPDSNTLKLALRSGGDGVPGSATYREHDTSRSVVEITCDGAPYTTIREITIAR